MAHVTKNSSVKNGYLSQNERLPEILKDPIEWRPYSYGVLDKKRSGCFAPKIFLETPLTDIKTWKKNIQVITAMISGEKAIISGSRISEINLQALKTLGLKTTTFLERISEKYDVGNFEFLDTFFECYNIEDFLKKSEELTHKQKKIFFKILGENCQKILKEFQEKLKKLSKIVELIKQVENTQIMVNEGIEIDNINSKIKKIDKQQIQNSFRYFKSEKVFNKRGFIFLNRKSLKLPDLLKIKKEGEIEEETFYTWLLKNLSKKISKRKKLLAFIMQGLSFNSFSFADAVLRKKFPAIFKIIPDEARLRLNSNNPTHFFIEKKIKGKNKKIKITQMKSYSFTVMPEDPTIQYYDIGEVKVDWKIKINSKKKIVSGRIFIKNITFFDNVSLDQQIKVLEKLVPDEEAQ